MTTPLVLVDPPAEPFWPLAATRPVAELLAGTRSFRARWSARGGRVEALWCEPAVARARLGGDNPPAVRTWPDPAEGYRVALSTWIPAAGWSFGDDPAEFRVDGRAVAWRLAPEAARWLAAAESPEEIRARLRARGLPHTETGGRVFDSIWSVVSANPDLVVDDATDFAGGDTIRAVDPVVLLGEPRDLKVSRGVAIAPFVVLDTRAGPIVLDEETRVEPHTVLSGPLYVGRESAILGGVVTGSTIGPRCKVRGDLEQTIIQGHTNKAHEGFFGHSAVGEWVNLGAGTTTSDLKNTYGSVRVEGPEGRIDTGLLKVGSFLGDHVKTGIGTLLTTGARVGVGVHLFGGGVSPRWLSNFSWHDGRERIPVRWDAFLRTAEIAMARRGRAMAEGEREILAALHAAAA